MQPADDSHEKDRLSGAEARRTLRRLLPHLRSHLRSLGVGLAAMAVTTGCQLAGPVLVRYVINEGIGRGAGSAVVAGTLGFVAVFLVGSGVGFLQVLVLTRMGLRIVTALKREIFGHLTALSTKFHDRTPVGKLIARTESDAEQVKELFSRNAVEIVRSALLFLGALGVLLVVQADIALIFLAIVPVLAGATWLFLRAIRRIYREVRRRYADLSATVTEYVQGAPVVQHYDQKERAVRLLDERNRAKFRADLKAWTLDYTFWGAFIYFETIAAAAIIWLGSEAMVGGRMNEGDLSLFLLYISLVFQPIMALGEQLSQVQRALAAADRVFDHLDTPPEVFDRPGARDRIRLEREIRFEDVSFAYTGDRLVLEGVSFSVRKGERVALVGPSGGGKTTLVSLLCRFVDPTRGRISVDGIDIREITLDAWRSRIGLVLQEIYLFPGTVLDNLRVLDDSIPESAVVRAAETVRADRFVRELPGGYRSDLAERGANLSLGERQLLSFARALAFDPEVLVLDEATSSVDTETETRIQESLSRLLEGRTAVIVAHRLSTIRAVDRILVIEKGRIVEEGDHEALYARSGLYRELYDLQTEGNGNGGPL